MFLIILISLCLALSFYYFLIKPQLFFKSKNVKQGPPIPIFGDSIWAIVFRSEAMMDFTRRVYNRFPNERYAGVYQGLIPTLILQDPDLLKQVTVKDFDHFTDHMNIGNASEIEPIFSKNLLFLKGEKWRDMRAILSPAFTGTKMRSMFELMKNSATQYVDFYLNSQDTQQKEVIELEMKDSLTRFANDVIANCAFGVTVDSLKERDNDFYAHSRVLTQTGLRQMVVLMLAMTMPKVAKFFNVSVFPRQTTEFFRNLFKNSVKMREEKNIIRPDMIHLLLEAQKGRLVNEENTEVKNSSETNSSKHKDLLTEEDMVAQMLIFFFAGFETVSIAAMFLCYELAVNPDIQQKLREEIDEIQSKNEELTYDTLQKMKYLDMCLSESLRKHPPAPFMDRICTKEYTIEPKLPHETPLHLKLGDVCWLPIAGIHHDEKYFEKPEKYDPERFSPENKDKIAQYTYIPFGSGPRNCIASRFALMEVKTLIFHIISKFELVVVKDTTIPLKYDTKNVNLAISGGCWLGLKRR